MNKRLVRCYKGFAVLPGKFNIEVFYTVSDMGYSNKLFICINCGEIFVIDFENPNFAGKQAQQIAGDSKCPNCSEPLKETLLPYPENFIANDGRIGQFRPDHIYPPDSESIVKDFWEIK